MFELVAQIGSDRQIKFAFASKSKPLVLSYFCSGKKFMFYIYSTTINSKTVAMHCFTTFYALKCQLIVVREQNIEIKINCSKNIWKTEIICFQSDFYFVLRKNVYFRKLFWKQNICSVVYFGAGSVSVGVSSVFETCSSDGYSSFVCVSLECCFYLRFIITYDLNANTRRRKDQRLNAIHFALFDRCSVFIMSSRNGAGQNKRQINVECMMQLTCCQLHITGFFLSSMKLNLTMTQFIELIK